MCKSVLVGVGLSSLITFGHAYGTTYYTALTGSDSNSCSSATSQSKPKRTIKAGIACLSAGDTLYIRAGTYDELLNPATGTAFPSGTSWSNPVTIAGYPGETVTIRPSLVTSNILNFFNNGGYTGSAYTQYLILDNLTIDGINNGPDPVNLVKFDVGSRYIRLQNSVIKNSSNANLIQIAVDQNYPTTLFKGIEILRSELYGAAGYGMYIQGESNLIDGNNIHDNNGYGLHIYLYQGGTVVKKNTVINNLIWHNGHNNPNPAGSCAVLLSTGDNNVAYNNVILDHNGCGIQIYANATNAKAYNNTIVGVVQECIRNEAGSSGAIIRNNICYNNGSDITDNGQGATIDHNTSNATNPQFVQATSADFHLQATSPAIDAGLTIAIVPMDIGGVSRPQGHGYDIGAYEYNGNQFATPSNLRVISTKE
jgi:hypothetical protein